MNPCNLKTPLLLLAVLGAGCFSGCESTTAPSATTKPAAAASAMTLANPAPAAETDPIPFDDLKAGMTMAEVEQRVGRPLETREGDAEQKHKITLWIYAHELLPDYKTVSTGMEEVPWYDPITGESRPQQRALLTQERTRRTELVVLAFADDKLVRITRQQRRANEIAH